ncbi:MAG: tetratricopeptide repeat protein [Sphingobacteriaceae bacterium]|nr:tetratricopeptide repeat protein [Sphingobacteriaceae bacterium]
MRLFFLFILLLNTSLLWAQSNDDNTLIYTAYQQGDYEKIYALTGKRMLENNTYFNFYINSVFRLRKFAEAEKLLKKTLKNNPISNAIALGRVYKELGEPDKAKKIYEQVIEKLKADEENIQYVARSFLDFEIHEYAIETLLKGRLLLNNPTLFSENLIQIYSLKKDKKKLISEYLIALGDGTKTLDQAQISFLNVFTETADYDELQFFLLKEIQKQPDKEVYSDLLIWQYLQKDAYEMAFRQLVAQDKRTNSNGEKMFAVSHLFNNPKAYASAEKTYKYLLAKGKNTPFYLAAKISLANINYEQHVNQNYKLNELDSLSNQYAEIITDYGINSKTFIAFKKWVQLQAYHLKKTNKVIEKIEPVLKSNLLRKDEIGEIKLALGDIYILNNEPWEAFLIYQQIAKDYSNNDIGNEATFRSSKLSYFQNDFTYAKAQIDVLKSATSQLISNDALNLSLLINDNLKTDLDSLSLIMFAQAELLAFKNEDNRVFEKLDSLNFIYPKNKLKDASLMLKSKIHLKSNEVEKAVANLTEIIVNHTDSIWMDDALFTLADIYEKKISNFEEAKKYYEKLIIEHSSSLHTPEARKRFRNLRGT